MVRKSSGSPATVRFAFHAGVSLLPARIDTPALFLYTSFYEESLRDWKKQIN